ncbi:PREDICTED: uncharacterized protein LOC18609449 [Theobroma cacao]|uniref:Uncharacterized protein LOC18609449 n=1 Tax=Theobroma cacao TaxID=3641 RepID=A0AB32VX06_THECC|nr:PREDICTED: uncharacterized protein LOC18609449 [Theobroma cacao]
MRRVRDLEFVPFDLKIEITFRRLQRENQQVLTQREVMVDQEQNKSFREYASVNPVNPLLLLEKARQRSRQPRADLIKDQSFRRNRQSDTLEKVNQILVKFECDRDKRIREKDSDRPSMQLSALMVHCR